MLRLRASLLALTIASLVGCSAPGTGEADPSQLYFASCSGCHGGDARGTDQGPDLTWHAADLETDEVVDVILDGAGSMPAVNLDADDAWLIADHVVEVLLAE